MAACPCVTGAVAVADSIITIASPARCRSMQPSPTLWSLHYGNTCSAQRAFQQNELTLCRRNRRGLYLSALPWCFKCGNLQLSRAAPVWNPQNVPDPQVMPQKDFGPEETVRAQLDALQCNDDPWPNHGLQTAYEFGEDIGGMERSRYFGYSKDLYHFDHFLGQFQNEFPELTSLKEYTIRSIQEVDGGAYSVDVEVLSRRNTVSQIQFLLQKKDVGRKKGCLMTKTLRRVDRDSK